MSEEQQENKEPTMLEQVKELIDSLKKDKFDFEKNMATFQWVYEEIPDYQIELTIAKNTEDNFPVLSEVMH